jgi:hypothetical protein
MMPTATVLCFVFGPVNDLLAMLQELIHGRAIRSTKVLQPPLFVIGHWRSGTTLLHELLHLDPRFASPTTYQCFAPWHFLLTEGWIVRFGGFLLPRQRPMDNMKAGWNLPQEDEFALMTLGAPTTYTRIAFPKEPVEHMQALTLDKLSQPDLENWKRCLDWFIRALTYHFNKPLILKSPPHTGRIGTLVEMYPNAKFIHIARDPRKLYPSTIRLWRALGQAQSMQDEPPRECTHNFVMESSRNMYEAFDAQRHRIPPENLVEIRYEDLVRETESTIERIYDQLQLGDFESVRLRIRQRQQQDKEYQTNQFDLAPNLESEILEAWHDYALRYGYAAARAMAKSVG